MYIFILFQNARQLTLDVTFDKYFNLPDEFTADGLLGMDFLNNNVVKIDLKNKQLWLKSQ